MTRYRLTSEDKKYKFIFQDEMIDLISTAMEKFQWEPTEIANYLKVRKKLLFVLNILGICPHS